MIGSINLWDPGHVTFTVDLITAFALGLVHGITPDEHTWPITFSYAVASHSTKRGLLAGLIFSVAFTGIALAVFGAVKGRLTGINMVKSAFQTILVGGLAAGAAFYLASLFGQQ